MNGPAADKIAAATVKAKAKAEAAKAKAEAAKAKQLADDQSWIDAKTQGMNSTKKEEVFREVQEECGQTTEKSGKLVLACPLPRKMLNCVDADPFDCANGTVDGSNGCKLSDSASSSLIDTKTGTKIDGKVTSAAEGGSLLSPNVPWGAFAHVDSKKGKELKPPELTTGNRAGVTIGTGVDLGQVDAAHADNYLKELKKRGVSQATLDRIKPFLGKQKEDACVALRTAKANGPMVFPQSDVELIDMQAMSSRMRGVRNAYNDAASTYVDEINVQIKAATKSGDTAKATALSAKRDAVPDWPHLTSAKQTIMFDSFYQEGNLDGSAAQFTNAVLNNDDVAAKKALTAKTSSKNNALASRGAVELDYFNGAH